jgi:hypothetical protein
MMRALLLVIAFLGGTTHASAQSDAETTREARTHFQQGLAQAQKGNLPAALREFETAYAIQPHFSVLYNVGRAHATLGHPVEAIAAFERYLQDGGAQVSEPRREEVASLLANARASIGRLRISITAGTVARVWLDGRELPNVSSGSTLDVAAGEHYLLHTRADGSPESQTIAVVPGEMTEVRLVGGVERRRDALLAVHCDIPDVSVDVGGTTTAKTPIDAPLIVPTGALLISFSRAGYRAVSETVSTRIGAVTAVRCDPSRLAPFPIALSARLAMSTAPTDASVTVDGQPFNGGALAAGRHRLRIERDGFEPQTQTVSLEAGKLTRYEATLAPTRANRDRQRASAAKQRTLGAVLGGVGVAIAAAGVGVFAWNSNRYDDWRAANDAGTAASIQRADDASVGLMVVGGSVLLAGSWLFLGAD